MTAPVTCNGSPPPQPALAVSKSTLSFTATEGGANPAAQTFDVTNTGGGTLSFTAAESASWLSLSPASGTAPATVTVTPSIAGLAPGTYTTPITVTAPGASGSPKTVDVTLTVNPGHTGARPWRPRALAFSGDPGWREPGRADGRRHEHGRRHPELHGVRGRAVAVVTPASGTAPAKLSVTPKIAGLAPGNYTGTVTITCGRRVRLAEDRGGVAHGEPGNTGVVGGAHESRVQRD